MLHPSDTDLERLFADTENTAVERKSANDVRDVLDTGVAFANSLPEGVPGVIFIPVKNDGTIETVPLDPLQKKITHYLNRAYPPLPAFIKHLRINGNEVLAVIVWGSPSRPHFAGPAYVRQGSETRTASEALFADLVASHLSLVRELLRHKGKSVIVEHIRPPSAAAAAVGRSAGYSEATVDDCSPFVLTLRMTSSLVSYALPRVQLSFNHDRQLLVIEVLN